MDLKAWINLYINLGCFIVKTSIWIYIESIYDPKNGYNEDKVWAENEGLFLFDYLANFMIKMSMFVFIFEMMRIWIFLSSNNA